MYSQPNFKILIWALLACLLLLCKVSFQCNLSKMTDDAAAQAHREKLQVMISHFMTCQKLHFLYPTKILSLNYEMIALLKFHQIESTSLSMSST